MIEKALPGGWDRVDFLGELRSRGVQPERGDFGWSMHTLTGPSRPTTAQKLRGVLVGCLAIREGEELTPALIQDRASNCAEAIRDAFPELSVFEGRIQ